MDALKLKHVPTINYNKYNELLCLNNSPYIPFNFNSIQFTLACNKKEIVFPRKMNEYYVIYENDIYM